MSHPTWTSANRSLRTVGVISLIAGCGHAPARVEPSPAPIATPAVPVESETPTPNADAVSALLAAKGLMVPVDGVTRERMADTYNAKRTTGTHRAIDILAPRGTPVLSADAGRVFRLRTNPNGGTTVYAIDQDEHFIYYYAHLERYRDGLAEGMSLEAGDVIGYVGTTGNAPPNLPHLHFQIMRYRRDRYWDGEPVNPYAFLTRNGKRRTE